MRITLGRPLPDGTGRVSQWFGEHPDWYAPFGMAGHNGLDYAAILGTPVLAAHVGMVQTGSDPTGYGNYVKVVGTRMTTIYAHLSHVSVKAGDRVQAGDQLGNVGSTGNSTGPHFHFGLRIAGVRNQAYGNWLDPMLGRTEGDA
jgi:murein DD-endopeptidase MepM/ murein hydrolase activator NlpD